MNEAADPASDCGRTAELCAVLRQVGVDTLPHGQPALGWDRSVPAVTLGALDGGLDQQVTVEALVAAGVSPQTVHRLARACCLPDVDGRAVYDPAQSVVAGLILIGSYAVAVQDVLLMAEATSRVLTPRSGRNSGVRARAVVRVLRAGRYGPQRRVHLGRVVALVEECDRVGLAVAGAAAWARAGLLEDLTGVVPAARSVLSWGPLGRYDAGSARRLWQRQYAHWAAAGFTPLETERLLRFAPPRAGVPERQVLEVMAALAGDPGSGSVLYRIG